MWAQDAAHGYRGDISEKVLVAWGLRHKPHRLPGCHFAPAVSVPRLTLGVGFGSAQAEFQITRPAVAGELLDLLEERDGGGVVASDSRIDPLVPQVACLRKAVVIAWRG
jgi:hypothetical protein